MAPKTLSPSPSPLLHNPLSKPQNCSPKAKPPTSHRTSHFNPLILTNEDNPLSNSQNPDHKLLYSNHVPNFSPPIITNELKSTYQSERGLKFETEDTFFRHESATGRDLGVLSATLYKQSKGQLRVLDAMCGCGVRSLRYLAEAEADFVMANDANDDNRRVIVGNLRSIERGSGEDKRWVVTHFDANRVLSESYLKREFFDLIDVDSFGSDSSFLRNVFNAIKFDGLLYLTSTDGYSSGGHRPNCSLAAYGAYIRPMPYSNEIGLRMLIGGAVRDASAQGYYVTPLFSYYSYHGPVFRVMFRVNRGSLPDNRCYGFVSYCTSCGNSQTYSWEELGQICCPCSNNIGSSSLVVSGPLWTGPLHKASYLTDMLNLAEQRGWVGNGTGTNLEKLLKRMIDESDPRLPVGYIKLDEMASRAKMDSPSLGIIMSAMHRVIHRTKFHYDYLGSILVYLFQTFNLFFLYHLWTEWLVWKLQEGYAVSRSHIASNAIKTNCSMTQCIRIAKQLQGCSG